MEQNQNKLKNLITFLIAKESSQAIKAELSILYWSSVQYMDILDVYQIKFNTESMLLIDYQINLEDGDYSSILVYFPCTYPKSGLFIHYNASNLYEFKAFENIRKNNSILLKREAR